MSNVKVVLASLGVVLLVVVLLFLFGAVTLPARSAVGVAEKVFAPNAIIGNYEWFKDQYNSILAQMENIKIMPEGSVERVGATMVLNQAIAEYNSRSSQITRNMWQSKDLPQTIQLGVQK